MDHTPNKRRKNVYRSARAMGIPHEDAEEIAQEIVLRNLEGKDEKQSAFHFVISELRRRGHDLRVKKNRSLFVDDEQVEHGTIGHETRPDIPLRLLEGLSHYDQEDRAIIVLRHMWGMTNKEIGFILGHTEDMIQFICTTRGISE